MKRPHTITLFILSFYTVSLLYTSFQSKPQIKDKFNTDYKSSHPLLGCILSICSAFFVGCSFILQKKGNMSKVEREKLDKSNQTLIPENSPKKSVIFECVWWQGILSLIAGEILQVAALKFAPTTLVSPLGAFRVIITTFLSKKILNENITNNMISGIVISVMGALLIILHSPREEINSDIEQTLQNSSVYFTFYVLVLIIYTIFGAFKVNQLKKTALNNPLEYKNLAFHSIFQTCTIGAVGVCCTKLMTMIKLNNAFNIINVIIVGLLVIGSPLQIYYVNVALAVDKASKVTPIKFAGTNILIVIGSTLLFNEWAMLSIIDIIGMISGLLIVISGIRLVVQE